MFAISIQRHPTSSQIQIIQYENRFGTVFWSEHDHRSVVVSFGHWLVPHVELKVVFLEICYDSLETGLAEVFVPLVSITVQVKSCHGLELKRVVNKRVLQMVKNISKSLNITIMHLHIANSLKRPI